MSFEIHGLGTATPPLGIHQDHASLIAQQFCCENAHQERLLNTLYRRAGVTTRYSVVLEPSQQPVDSLPTSQASGQNPAETFAVGSGIVSDCPVTTSFFEPAVNPDDCGPTTTQRMQMYEQHAPRLAKAAATAALEQAGWAAGEITHLITISCTGFAAPGVDLALIRECGLPPGIARTHVGFMGCHAALNGLRVAQAYADADPSARVLMCAVELCSLHQQYGWHPERIVSNSLFADGAAAVVGCGSDLRSPSQRCRVKATASTVIDGTEEMMNWFIRDHGFEMSLSAEVPNIIRERLKPWLSGWLQSHGLSWEEIGSWAVHPGGPRILRACEEAMGFDAEQLRASHEILSEYGNMSSPTVLFILQRLLQRNQPLPMVMLAFGPGLCIEAGLLV